MEGFDCQSCGACCISTWDTETYVGVDEEDLDRMLRTVDESVVDRMVADRGDVWQMGLYTKENGQGHITCIALSGDVGDCVSCSIYDARPNACRHFRPGSLECKLARDEAGIASSAEKRSVPGGATPFRLPSAGEPSPGPR